MARSALARSLLPRRRAPLFAQSSLRSTTWHARHYSLQADDATDPRLRAVDASSLTIEKTATPKQLTPNEELVFGKHFTDHMLTMEWTAADGWLPPRITPYQNFSLDPATSVLHYAFTAFEGTKAYKDKDGHVRLFRPDMNMKRLNKSVARISLPTFEEAPVIDLIKKFVEVDSRFVPS